MGGETKQIGSVDDVKMVNQNGFNDYLTKLTSAMNGFSSGLGSSGSGAANMFGRVADTATNYDNFLRSVTGGTGGFSPTASLDEFMSRNGQFNTMAQGALSDVYTSGRAQAAAAGDSARRQAANELSAAGLLSSGGAVGAMTEATANPILGMETSLANTRANYLSGLQGNALQNLGSQYGLANQLGLGAIQGGTGALGQAASGYGSLASLYGGLYGQGLGYGARMNAPEYWQPQYEKQPGFLDYLNAGTSLFSAIKPFGL